MNLTIKEQVTKEEWESAIKQFREANFLQSFNWGDFHHALGKKVIRLLLELIR